MVKPTFGIYSQNTSKFKPILTLTAKKKWNKTLWRTALVLECCFLGTKMQKSRCKLQTRVYLCNLNAETVGTVTQVVACLAGGIVFAREFWWRSRHRKPREASAEGARKFVSSPFSAWLRSSSANTFLARKIPPAPQAIQLGSSVCVLLCIALLSCSGKGTGGARPDCNWSSLMTFISIPFGLTNVPSSF